MLSHCRPILLAKELNYMTDLNFLYGPKHFRADRAFETRILFRIVIMLSTSLLADGLMPLNAAVLCGKNKPCPVWHNPCGVFQHHWTRQNAKRDSTIDNEIAPTVGLRHASVRPLRRVRTQLRITYNHFRSLQNDIARVYSGVKNLLREEYEYDWLPEHQFNWYRDNIRCLDKKSKVRELLPTLHSSLQNFSATFEVLSRLGNNHQMALQSIRRRKVLTDISQEIKKLLCEVETCIFNMGVNIPDRLSIESVNSMKWDNRPDHTGGLIQDWGVLAAYQNFLDDWIRIIRRLVGKKSNIPCKPKPTPKKKKKKSRKKPEKK